MTIASEVVKDVANPIRGYLELAGVVIAIATIVFILWYQRHIEHQKDVAADTAALAAAKEKADLQTQLNQERADNADKQSDHDAQLIADYRAAHPEQPVRVCIASNSQPGVPKGGPDSGKGPTGAIPGSAPVRDVQTGSPSQGVDIGPELDTIVQVASRLAIADRNFQKRDLPAPAK
jgi:hypothetical protein